MLALAAATLGYRSHVFTPETESPAGQVAAFTTIAAFDDEPALDAFSKLVDVVTIEFENIPVAAVERLVSHVTVRPGANALRIAQDRLAEKEFARKVGGGTADFRAVDSAEQLAEGLAALGLPALLKTRRLGYDGKGQARIERAEDAEAAWKALAPQPCILEAFVPFQLEISLLVARGADGAMVCYPPVENRHSEGILRDSRVPAAITPDVAEAARALAEKIATELDYVGVLAVEMFVTPKGEVLVNELAPRVHNSGHLTIEACATSQFEQHIRAVCALPLGDVSLRGRARMRNLIGEDVNDWRKLIADPRARLHLYGKREIRAGRKMGHVTWLEPAG